MWAHGMAHKMLNGRLTGGSYIVMIEKWQLLTLPFYLALATFHTQDQAAVKVRNRTMLLGAKYCQKTSAISDVFFGVECNKCKLTFHEKTACEMDLKKEQLVGCTERIHDTPDV